MGAGPYGLLVSNVNAGYGGRPWGQSNTAQAASSFMTLWNMASNTRVRGRVVVVVDERRESARKGERGPGRESCPVCLHHHPLHLG